MQAKTTLRSASNTSRSGQKASGGTILEITRHIPAHIACTLWGRAAGRCEFAGCNKPLWKSSVAQEVVSQGEKAHIYSFSDRGPRGNSGIPKKQLNDLHNLLLVCPECHRKIDKERDGGRYTTALLRQWKEAHERRIEMVTGIAPCKKSHVLLYGANVGEQSTPLDFIDAATAMFPHRYPAQERPLVLKTINSVFTDRSARFWDREEEHLVAHFEQQVRSRMRLGEIAHLSVFAIAPQPLLIRLGTLLSDLTETDVFQRHREPQTWEWPKRARRIELAVEEPSGSHGVPALVLALSAPVTDDRIRAVVGTDAAIWRVTVARPNTDLIKSRTHLAAFRGLVGSLLDRIKACHGQTTPLHVFPAMGVSAAVEFGRVRMPKSHMPWIIYDQVNDRGGFVHALTIPQKEHL